MISEEELDALLARYLSGQLREGDMDLLQNWAKLDAHNERLLADLQRIKQENQKKINTLFPEKPYERIWEKIEKQPSFSAIPHPSWRNLGKYAAAIFLALTVAFIGYRQFLTPNVQQKIALPTLIEKSNPPGQKSKVFLPDGSWLWLNADSKITYDQSFNDSLRIVHLSGEAYFNIKSDATKPFKVITNGLTTTALGTAFNVKAFENENYEEVALAEGKVNVEVNPASASKSSNLILTPGEMAAAPANTPLSKSSFDFTEKLGWKDGILYFRNANLAEVIDKLERWYGVTIHHNSPGDRAWKFTAEFHNEYLDNILKVLGETENFQFKINKDNVELIFPDNGTN